MKLETASGDDDDYDDDDDDDDLINVEEHKINRSVCGRLQFASPRRPDLLFTPKELGRGLANEESLAVSEAFNALLTR
eukprot:3011739-Amphidinium_carterae.4